MQHLDDVASGKDVLVAGPEMVIDNDMPPGAQLDPGIRNKAGVRFHAYGQQDQIRLNRLAAGQAGDHNAVGSLVECGNAVLQQ